MRRYICPSCQGTCRCGRTRPADPLTSGHASAVAVIACLFALGGMVSLFIWALPHPGRLWAPVLLIALVTWMILIKDKPVRRR